MSRPEGYTPKVRPEKVEAVDRIKRDIQGAEAVLLTEYRGLRVPDIGQLRDRLRENEVAYRVVKNTLASRAAAEVGYAEMDGLFEGPTAVAYCYGDPVAGAKVLADFARTHPGLTIKGGILAGHVISQEEARSLASVDAIEVSRAKIAGGLTSSLQAIVMMLEAPVQRMLYVLEQLAARSGGDGSPSAAAGGAEAPAGADGPSGDGGDAGEAPEESGGSEAPGSETEEGTDEGE